jgi:hypothetical protein
MGEIQHLSKSQVCQILEACGNGYYLERILGIKPRPSVGPIVGQTLHTCQEYYFRQVLEGVTPGMLEITKKGQEKFDELFSAPDLNYGNLFKKFGEPDTALGRANIRGLKHAEFLAGLAALVTWWEKITPRYVELPALFDIEHRNSTIRLKVFADLICDYQHEVTRTVEVEIEQFGAKGQPIKPKRVKEQQKTGEIVNIGSIDLKVSGMPKTQRTVDTDIALPIAVYAQYLTDGTLPEYAGYLNCVLKTSPVTKNVSVDVRMIYTKIDTHKLEVMIERVKKVRDSIDCGIFLPCAPTHWKCTPDFCDHFPCQYAVKIEENEEGDDA